MKVIVATVIACALIACTACTKQNPDACCTDEADCQMIGLPNGTTCSDGLVCRGNQCIAETCSGASDCDAATPYCDALTMTCEESCTGDMECPGFGGSAVDTFCVSGGCVQCREGMSDCAGDTPVCDASGACRGCQANTDCASDLCDISSGACVDMADVLYASAGGADTADCSQGTPCSITHAIASVTATKNQIVMAQGTYGTAISITTGATMTIYGNISILDQRLTISKGSKVTIQDLAINGFTCSDTSAPDSTATLVRTPLGPAADNTVNDIEHCDVSLLETTLTQSEDALQFNIVVNGTITADRSVVPAVALSGTGSGSAVEAVMVTNSLLGLGNGQIVYPELQGVNNVSVTVSFSTIYGYIGCASNTGGVSGVVYKYSNVIVTAPPGDPQSINTGGGPIDCYDHVIAFPQPGTVPAGVTVADPLFVDEAIQDFHIKDGSPAIDAADAQIDHDFDGTPRPQGSGYDIGAFEYH